MKQPSRAQLILRSVAPLRVITAAAGVSLPTAQAWRAVRCVPGNERALAGLRAAYGIVATDFSTPASAADRAKWPPRKAGRPPGTNAVAAGIAIVPAVSPDGRPAFLVTFPPYGKAA
jgi:hypothetical protein